MFDFTALQFSLLIPFLNLTQTAAELNVDGGLDAHDIHATLIVKQRRVAVVVSRHT